MFDLQEVKSTIESMTQTPEEVLCWEQDKVMESMNAAARVTTPGVWWILKVLLRGNSSPCLLFGSDLRKKKYSFSSLILQVSPLTPCICILVVSSDFGIRSKMLLSDSMRLHSWKPSRISNVHEESSLECCVAPSLKACPVENQSDFF